jgi:ABC-type antimicrobial peptide transport system permease subunit
MREFGIRLAVGAAPRQLLARVLGEGAIIAGAGIIAGTLSGLAFVRLAAGIFGVIRMPGALAIAGAAALLLLAAVTASLLPAARASRVDALTALRTD